MARGDQARPLLAQRSPPPKCPNRSRQLGDRHVEATFLADRWLSLEIVLAALGDVRSRKSSVPRYRANTTLPSTSVAATATSARVFGGCAKTSVASTTTSASMP